MSLDVLLAAWPSCLTHQLSLPNRFQRKISLARKSCGKIPFPPLNFVTANATFSLLTADETLRQRSYAPHLTLSPFLPLIVGPDETEVGLCTAHLVLVLNVHVESLPILKTYP